MYDCDVNRWGHPLWCIIHILTCSIKMESNNLENFKFFLDKLQVLIPCIYCRQHYKININRFLKNNNHWKNEIFQNQKLLIYSLIIIHRQINIDNNVIIKSNQYYYDYWNNKKNKQKILTIYKHNLKLCQNISEEVLILIDNINIIL